VLELPVVQAGKRFAHGIRRFAVQTHSPDLILCARSNRSVYWMTLKSASPTGRQKSLQFPVVRQ
jgi:hypothetical protein